MRRSTALSLALQLVFPDLSHTDNSVISVLIGGFNFGTKY
jgi:hypothetical protein